MKANVVKTLLLIEDSLGDARLLREVFNENNAQAIQLTLAQSMKDAEALLATLLFDVILLDLGLPDAQGMEAVRRVRLAAPSVPLVVLTGFDDDALASQALQEGAQDYLVKGKLDSYGSSRGLMHALRCAVDRKVIEDALFVEKERAEVTLSSIGEGVICTDSAGDVTFLNAVAEELTGWSKEDAVGRPIGRYE